MNPDKPFENWKQHKADFRVTGSFCDDIMQIVTAPKKRKTQVDFLIWFNALTTEPLARFGVIIVGALGGLCRVVLTFCAMVSESAPLI
jgi:hypothetical protein